MTVYIAHESRNCLDLTPAQEFGDIEFVFTRDFSAGFNPKEATVIASKMLENFDFEKEADGFIDFSETNPFGDAS